jgi:hypothetical protein
MRHHDLAFESSTVPAPTTIILPVAEARTKAREIINPDSSKACIPSLKNWRQRSDGQIDVTVGALRAQDESRGRH